MGGSKSNPIQRLRHMLSRWDPLLRNPRWYLTVVAELNAFRESITRESSDLRHICKERVYDFFEDHLRKGDIALAPKPIDSDADRKWIDTIVIHHTSNPPGLRPERLSAIELIRLYAPYHAHQTRETNQRLEAISSGHVRKGKQVFWPYHWIVRANGAAERLLYDSEIGWHAGNWDINCRSIAIVLDNDYENSRPSGTELAAIAAIIKQHYSRVPLGRILGHREVNARTVCPSNLFLDVHGRTGWKSELLRLCVRSLERAA